MSDLSTERRTMINLNEVIAKYGNQEVDEQKIKDLLGIKESKVWKPIFGENAWLVFASGGVQSYCANNELDKFYGMGVVYKTKEEAEFARDKQIFLTKFERYLRENEDEPVDWDNYDQDKFCAHLVHTDKCVNASSWYSRQCQGVIYTTNEFALEQFIKDNEADIKKYMFGVK